jgi:hypothetical protein
MFRLKKKPPSGFTQEYKKSNDMFNLLAWDLKLHNIIIIIIIIIIIKRM